MEFGRNYRKFPELSRSDRLLSEAAIAFGIDAHDFSSAGNFLWWVPGCALPPRSLPLATVDGTTAQFAPLSLRCRYKERLAVLIDRLDLSPAPNEAELSAVRSDTKQRCQKSVVAHRIGTVARC